MSILSNPASMGHRRKESGHSVASSSAGGSISGTLLVAGTDPGKPRRRRESNEGGWNVPARRTSTFQDSAAGSSYGKSYGTPTTPTMNLEQTPLPTLNGQEDEDKSVEQEEHLVPQQDRQQTIKPDLSRLAIPPSPQLPQKEVPGQPWSPSTVISTSPSEATTVAGRTSSEIPDSGRPMPRKRKRASHPGVIKLHYTFKDHTSLCEYARLTHRTACRADD